MALVVNRGVDKAMTIVGWVVLGVGMTVLTESAEAGRRVYAISAGENIGSTSNTLAIAITRTMTLVFTGRHSEGILPRLRR